MSVAFIFIAYVLGVLSCVVGLAFGATCSDGDEKLNHALFVDRVIRRLNETEMPDGLEKYPTDRVWYIAMKKAIEIVKKGGREN